MGHSVLQIPVPSLEPFVRARHAHYDGDYVSKDPGFVHAHITVLGPFLEVVDEESATAVASIAAGIDPFDVRLERVETFPDGIIHLRPEPDEPFRALTQALWDAFPQCPPYGGEFDDVVPHLTLDHSSQVTVESVRAGLALPTYDRAERIDLAWYEPGNCHLVRSWPLGSP
jgi:2'-5' RNA ligase